jgi:hypothetical protein
MSNGEMVRFTRSALDGMAEQVQCGFIPIVIEHLCLLPPCGRWHSAKVVAADDGADELILYGRLFRTLHPVGADPDLWTLLRDDRPVADTCPSIATINLEPRNFGQRAFAVAQDNAPVEIQEVARWSELPPLEWILVIPVIWGATKFLGGFLEELGKESALAAMDWIAALATHAKDPDRDRIITFQFTLPSESPTGARIDGFVPINASADITREALPALDGATRIAELAGAQAESLVMGDLRQAAFIWREGEWHLAWWVGSDDTVRTTNWFLANEPDPARFLGRPLLPKVPPEVAS